MNPVACPNCLLAAPAPHPTKVGNRSNCRPIRTLLLLCVCLIAALGTQARAQTAHFTFSDFTFSAGGSYPTSVAVDGSANAYVIGGNPGAPVSLTKIPAGCVSYTCQIAITGSTNPIAVAADQVGNVYVSDAVSSTENVLKRLPAGCLSATCATTITGFTQPTILAVDIHDNLYTFSPNTQSGTQSVQELPAGCTAASCVVTLGGGLSHPAYLAADNSGNVYITEPNPDSFSGDYNFYGNIKEIPAGCISAGCTTVIAANIFDVPEGIAVDGSGNLYIADNVPDTPRALRLSELPAGCTSASCVYTYPVNLSDPDGSAIDSLAVDQSGNHLFVANSEAGTLDEILKQGAQFSPSPVGTTVPSYATTLSVVFTFDSAGTIGKPLVVTQGAQNLDFTDAGGGTCDQLFTASTPVSAGQTCTVSATFKPTHPGLRQGAVELTNSSGAAIATAYVSGIGTAPQIVFPSNNVPVTLGGGFNQPYGIAVDANGNVFVADTFNNKVEEVPAGCASADCVTTIGGGFYEPNSLALDGAGNIYVADYAKLKEISVGCTSSSCVTTFADGVEFPIAVAVDGQGNVYVTDSGTTIKKIPTGCSSSSCVITLGSGFTSAAGVAVDEIGNVFVTDLSSNALVEIPAGCKEASCERTLGGGFNQPYEIATDGRGNVFVSDSNNSEVKELKPDCYTSACVLTLSGSFTHPFAVTIDGTGNLYVADTGNNRVGELPFATPPSLSFNVTEPGQTSTDSPKKVTVGNDGNAPLLFSSIAASANFTMDNATTCPKSLPIDPGQTCTLAIDFNPQGPGNPLTGSIILTDDSLNASNATQVISLSGVGNGTAQAITFPAPASPVTYGVAPITLSATGGASGNAVTFSVTGPGSLSGKTLTITGAGTVMVTANQAGNTGYYPAPPVSHSIVVNKAPLAVGPHAPLPGTTTFSVGYGNYSPAQTDLYQITGFVNGENIGSLTGQPTAVPQFGTNPAVGRYPLQIGLGTLSSPNYTFTVTSGTITVTPAVLTVKPNSTMVKYGSSLPTLTYALTGLKYGQTASVLSSLATEITTAKTGSPVGSYPISANVSGITAANYTVVAGPPAELTITPATLQVKALSTSIKQGAPIPTFSYALSGLTNGDTASILTGKPTITTTAVQGSPTGTYPIKVNVTGTSAANYNVTAGPNATLTIKP